MELIYKKPGNIELIRYENGVDGTRFLKNGVVNSISSTHTVNTSTLPNGNSARDLLFSTGVSETVTVNLSSFQPALYAALAAADIESGNFALRKVEETSIPSASPWTVTLTKTPTGDPVIHNEDNSPFIKVATSPAVGQFSVSASTVTFNSADAGQEVVIAYDTTVTNANKMSYPAEPKSSVFRMIIAGEAVLRKDEGTAKLDTMVFDRVYPSGEFAPPARQKEPQGWSFTMTVLDPRPGYKPVDYYWEQ